MQSVGKMLDVLFVVGLVAFMGLGTIIVVVQLFAVLTTNGPLATSVSKALAKPACVAASIAGLIGFIEGYIYHWKTGD